MTNINSDFHVYCSSYIDKAHSYLPLCRESPLCIGICVRNLRMILIWYCLCVTQIRSVAFVRLKSVGNFLYLCALLLLVRLLVYSTGLWCVYLAMVSCFLFRAYTTGYKGALIVLSCASHPWLIWAIRFSLWFLGLNSCLCDLGTVYRLSCVDLILCCGGTLVSSGQPRQVFTLTVKR